MVHTLFMTIGLSFGNAWSQVPVNDQCADAIPLTVHPTGFCPSNSIPGSNAQATWNGVTPACSGGQFAFPDVWYAFNSGDAFEVDIRFLFGSITDWGIEVYDGCQGSLIYCGTFPDLLFPVSTDPFTDYVFRVFTDTENGDPGTFQICLSADFPPPLCEGNTVKTDQGEIDLFVCTDGIPDPTVIVNFSTAIGNYTYILTDADDRIIAELPGGALDPDTLAAGFYRVYGVSYDGDLGSVRPDSLLRTISSTGACIEFSDNFVEITVDLCTSIPSHDVQVSMVLQDDRLWMRIADDLVAARLEWYDARGSLLGGVRLDAAAGTELLVPLGSLPPGMLITRLSDATGTLHTRRWVVMERR